MAGLLRLESLAVVLTLLAAAAARALPIDLEPPGPREFVRDLAGLISEADRKQIQKIGDQLLTDKATPILVVTIESMAQHGGANLRIETFARLLFDQWEIGHAQLPDGQPWNTGILLLVSKGDRKARIELGAGWKRDKDLVCQRIMDQIIILRFKQGQFSEGIVAGVTALDQMVREGLTATSPLPAPAQAARSSAPSIWPALLGVGVAVVLILTVVSLVRSGTGGWGWLVWAAVFGVLGFVLWELLRPRSSGSTNSGSGTFGGGFSGGTFGGGFSGGGGATGSW